MTTVETKVVSTNTPVYTYALLQETNDRECESWYYFIRYQGNEEALAHLEKQLDSVDWYTMDDLSTFVIETEYLVSEQTAKEMTKVDINPAQFHRKFDGKLQMIDLGLSDKYSTEKKIKKVCKKLGDGKIEQFVDGEDIDPEDLADEEDESGSESESGSGSESESESDTESEQDQKKESRRDKRISKLPSSLTKSIVIPRVAQAKQHRK